MGGGFTGSSSLPSKKGQKKYGSQRQLRQFHVLANILSPAEFLDPILKLYVFLSPLFIFFLSIFSPLIFLPNFLFFQLLQKQSGSTWWLGKFEWITLSEAGVVKFTEVPHATLHPNTTLRWCKRCEPHRRSTCNATCTTVPLSRHQGGAITPHNL